MYEICSYLKYLIFAISRIYPNCWFKTKNQGYITQPFTKNRPFRNLIRHFQYFHYSNFDMTYVTNFIEMLPFFRESFRLSSTISLNIGITSQSKYYKNEHT